MLRHLGYVAITLSAQATTNRTCRLRNATPERLRALIRANLEDLCSVLEFNARNSIFLYRISSQVIPFASHPVNRVQWWNENADLFVRMADFIACHRMRVSMHPGHFTVLNSATREVVEASIRELEWHVRFLNCLRTDSSSKLVVHVGGACGGKAESAHRFVTVMKALPEDIRRRLVIENDERVYTVRDVLDIGRRTGTPVVFDWLHHRANPGEDWDTMRLLIQCFETWSRADGVPKVHFSSQAGGGPVGTHADWIDAGEFEAFLRVTPPTDFDCMLEAKRKDLALFQLRRELSDRGLREDLHGFCGS